MTSTQLALTLITLKILWTRIAFSAWSERPPSFQSKKSTIHLRGFANEFVMAIKGKNLSSHDKRWLTTPCTATLQNKRETFNTLFWTLRKSKIQSGELHSVTFNESVVSAMHTRPLRQRGANLSLSQVTSSDLQQGLKGSGSHGLTAADFNPTQNQAALQKSPPQQGLENTRIQSAWGILAKNHGLSHSPGLSWRTEWQGADGEEPPHGRSKATKVTKSTSLWKMATPFCLDTAAQGGQKRSPCSGVGGLLFFVGFGEGFVVWLVLQMQLPHALSFPCPSLVLPVGWTGFVLFQCVAVECNSSTVLAQLRVFLARATTFPRGYKTTASSVDIQMFPDTTFT